MSNEKAIDAAKRADELRTVARAYERAHAAMRRRREALHEAIVDSVLLMGMSKSEAARLSGYTREYVAKLCEERPASVGPPKRRRREPDHD